MMRYLRHFFTLCAFSYSTVVSGQNPDHVIILVDVSKSIKLAAAADSIPANMLVDLLHGEGFHSSLFAFRPAAGNKEGIKSLERTWINKDQKILLVPYGDLDRDRLVRAGTGINVDVFTDEYGDFKRLIGDKWPKLFTDQWSYQTLARGRATALARQHGLASYWLFVVSDNLAGYSVDSLYDKEQEEVIRTNVSKEFRLGRLVYGRTRFGIDVSHIELDSTRTPEVPENPTLAFTKNKQGTADQPVVFDKSVSLSWICTADTVKTFSLYVSTLEGKPVKRVDVPTTTKQFPLPDGRYKVTVTGGGMQAVTYIQVGSANYGWLIGLVLIGALVFLFWKYLLPRLKRKPKPDPSDVDDGGRLTSNKPRSRFS